MCSPITGEAPEQRLPGAADATSIVEQSVIVAAGASLQVLPVHVAVIHTIQEPGQSLIADALNQGSLPRNEQEKQGDRQRPHGLREGDLSHAHTFHVLRYTVGVPSRESRLAEPEGGVRRRFIAASEPSPPSMTGQGASRGGPGRCPWQHRGHAAPQVNLPGASDSPLAYHPGRIRKLCLPPRRDDVSRRPRHGMRS